MIDLYMTHSPGLVEAPLAAAAARANSDELYQAVHALKSSTANLGGTRLAGLARDCESARAAGTDWLEALQLLPRIQQGVCAVLRSVWRVSGGVRRHEGGRTSADVSTVLVVDDDPGAQLLAQSALELAGFRVRCAADGNAGLAAFKAHAPDCIVLDVIMPGMNGFQMCEKVRALPGGQHVPVLMMTSLDDMESVSRAYTAGATDFASKGVNPDVACAARESFWCGPSIRRISCAPVKRMCAISPTTIR